MLSCIINRVLFNIVVIIVVSRVRRFTKVFYFVLLVWYILYIINTELN